MPEGQAARESYKTPSASHYCRGKFTEAQVTYFYTGNQLLEWCEGDTNIEDHICRGYIVGTYDTTSAHVVRLKF